MEDFIHHILFSFVLTTVLLLVSTIAAPVATAKQRQMLSSYECGFESMTTGSAGFDLQFYGLVLVFLIFDIEICFFVPFVKAEGPFTLIPVFLNFVTLGFLIE